MSRTPVPLASIVLLTVPLTGVASAASPAAASSPDRVHYGEAPSGTYEEQYDDYGSEVTVVRRTRIALTFQSGWPNGEEGVASTQERSIAFTYDAERNTGTFTVRSGWFDPEVGDLVSCPPG